jgi:5,10-methenyltetrahydrofolate synthetase
MKNGCDGITSNKNFIVSLIFTANTPRSLLRKTFKAKRAAFVQQLSAEQLSAYGLSLIARFLHENPLDSAAIIGAYWALPSEFPTQGFIQHCLHHAIEIALPTIESDQAMTFRKVIALDRLEPNRFGIMQPARTAPLVTPTHILVPGLGFDMAGHRLGYGKGYYDQFLSQTPGTKPKTIGVGFACQKMAGFIPQPHDVPLDQVYYF